MLCDAMRHAAVGLAASACSRLDYVELFQRYVSRRSTARTRRHKTQNTHRYDLVCRICQFALMPSYMQWEEEVTLISVCDQRSTKRLKACRTERCARLCGFVSARGVANKRTNEQTNRRCVDCAVRVAAVLALRLPEGAVPNQQSVPRSTCHALFALSHAQ